MLRPGTSLTAQKKRRHVAAAAGAASARSAAAKKPTLESFLDRRDFIGARTLLEFEKRAGQLGEGRTRHTQNLWLAYVCYHSGDFEAALALYDEMVGSSDPRTTDRGQVQLFRACCLYALDRFRDAHAAANLGPDESLRNRLLLNVAHKEGNESDMLRFHDALKDSAADELCTAGVQYLRSHYQEALDIYKRLVHQHRDFTALSVYMALAYYRLDYFDVALDVLNPYLSEHPDSVVATNLKACTNFRLYTGKVAEQDLRALAERPGGAAKLAESDLLRHNLCVFSSGEGALSVLPPLLDIIPEARLNLVIYHLRKKNTAEAMALIKDYEPSSAREYVLKGVVYSQVGQESDSRDLLRAAQQHFQLVGASATECDTIHGRQCMGSLFFLLKEWNEVGVYLKSIHAYHAGDHAFAWNYGIALAADGKYKEAKEILHSISDDSTSGAPQASVAATMKKDFVYQSWLARCYIFTGEPEAAWELYQRIEHDQSTSTYNLLHVLANDCYRMGHFYYACKAFDVLAGAQQEEDELWEGKKGAAIGVFQQVCARREDPGRLQEVADLLRKGTPLIPQIEFIVNRVMKKWARENDVPLV